jgi:LysM repeat protein
LNTRIKSKLLLFCTLISLFSFSQSDRQLYIDTYDVVAMREMKEYGIPASITLAQGILESGNGKSKLASKSNNHFGIKCHDWKGAKVYHDDDKKNECFRKYKKADESYRDHSVFLSTRSRYAFLFDLKQDDYKGWAKGLQKAGYATSNTYAKLLIRLIEENDLTRFDQEVLKGSGDWLSGTIVKVSSNNLKYVDLDENQSIEDIAAEFDVSVDKLLTYNDYRWDDQIESKPRIYIQQKKTKGPVKKYVVKQGETMHSISQKMGIKLSSLYSRNKMRVGAQPRTGQTLYLKGKKK